MTIEYELSNREKGVWEPVDEDTARQLYETRLYLKHKSFEEFSKQESAVITKDGVLMANPVT